MCPLSVCNSYTWLRSLRLTLRFALCSLPFLHNRNPRAIGLFEKAPKLWEVVTLFQVEAVGAERRLCSIARWAFLHLHKVSTQTIPSLWYFESGAISVSGVDCSVVVLFSATSTPSVHIKLQILYFTSRLHILGRHRWVHNACDCWGLRRGLSSTRDPFLCGGSSTAFLFVNRILEQVVRIVGFNSCSYHVMLDCFITGLFGHLQTTLLGVGGISVYCGWWRFEALRSWSALQKTFG